LIERIDTVLAHSDDGKQCWDYIIDGEIHDNGLCECVFEYGNEWIKVDRLDSSGGTSLYFLLQEDEWKLTVFDDIESP